MRHALSRRTTSGEEGVIIPLVGLLMVVLLVFTAIVVDLGQAREQNRQARAAADAGALAGAEALQLSVQNPPGCPDAYCAAAYYTLASADRTPASAATFAASQAPCTIDALKSGETCWQYTVGNAQVDIKSPYNQSGTADSSLIHVTVCWSDPTAFARVIGVTSVKICGRATAKNTGVTSGSGPPTGPIADCGGEDNFADINDNPQIYAFNAGDYPNDGGTLDLTKAQKVIKNGMILVVLFNGGDSDLDLSSIAFSAPTNISGLLGQSVPLPRVTQLGNQGPRDPLAAGIGYTLQSLAQSSRSVTDGQSTGARSVNDGTTNVGTGRAVTNGSTTSGLTTITSTQGGGPPFTDMDFGAAISGPGIAAGSTIAAVVSPNQASLSTTATSTTGPSDTWTVTQNSATVTSGQAHFAAGDVGASVVGTDIPLGATIAAVSTNNHSARLTAAATAAINNGNWTIGADSTTVTSGQAHFTSADVGDPISGTNVQAGTTIVAFNSGNSVTLSKPLTAPTLNGNWTITTSGTPLVVQHSYTPGGTHAVAIAYQLPGDGQLQHNNTPPATGEVVFTATVHAADLDQNPGQDCGNAAWEFTHDGNGLTTGTCGENSFLANGVFPANGIASPGTAVGAFYSDESVIQSLDTTNSFWSTQPVNAGIDFELGGGSFTTSGTNFQIPQSATPGTISSTDGYTLTDSTGQVANPDHFNTRIQYILPGPQDPRWQNGVKYTVFLKAYDTDNNKPGNDCGQGSWSFILTGASNGRITLTE